MTHGFYNNPIISTWSSDFDKDKTHIYFKKLFHKYGSVLRVKFPGQPTLVMLSQPEHVKTILQSSMDNPVRLPMESLKKARYQDAYYDKKAGVVGENGPEWSRVASILRPKVLRPDNVHQYLPQVDQVALDFLHRRLRETPADPGVCLISLNQRLGCLDPSLPTGSGPEHVIAAARDFMTAIKECETGSKLWKLYPTKMFKQLQKSMDMLKETCNGVLEEIESKMQTKLEENPGARLTMVEQLLSQRDLSRKDVITFMIDLIPGGTDTVSNNRSTMADMAAVILYLLAKNPDAQRSLQKELDRVLGDGAAPLTPHHLNQFSYLKAVVKEANRMDENEFEHHEQFLPERWLRHRPYGTIHPCASLPFSFGTRMCIGRRIAEQEIYTLVARMLHRYNVEWKHGELERPLKYVFSPAGPLKFTFIDRQIK
ncbi:putative cytochrome P450 49a1 [Chionoecetes opilio]|uniref:Putative cytochrome P450 49a1 n=1 Tax=Chionoecetes opilio TaxID=41210 RepID=A0A8J4YFK3_CHIOP|nr:putative cytochrome P450 49a1 [Chionoecetes opilio]